MSVTIIWILVILLSCGVVGLFTSRVAEAKNYDGQNWFFAGFFFGIVGLLAIIGLPARTAEEAAEAKRFVKKKWYHG